MPESRKAKRTERLDMRREERAARKSPETGSRRNLWLALGGALAIGVILVGGLALAGGGDDTAPSTAPNGAGTVSSASAEGDFPVVAYPQGIAALGPEQLDFSRSARHRHAGGAQLLGRPVPALSRRDARLPGGL